MSVPAGRCVRPGALIASGRLTTDGEERPMRAIDVYDDELAVMHERVTGGMDAAAAATVTAGYSRSGVTPERLEQLYPTWAALAEIGAE